MTDSEFADPLIKFFAPVGLIMAPVALAILLIAPVNPDDRLSSQGYFEVMGMCFYGIYGGFYSCKTRLGWFRNHTRLSTSLGALGGIVWIFFICHILVREHRAGEKLTFASLALFSILLAFSIFVSSYYVRRGMRDGYLGPRS